MRHQIQILDTAPGIINQSKFSHDVKFSGMNYLINKNVVWKFQVIFNHKIGSYGQLANSYIPIQILNKPSAVSTLSWLILFHFRSMPSTSLELTFQEMRQINLKSQKIGSFRQIFLKWKRSFGGRVKLPFIYMANGACLKVIIRIYTLFYKKPRYRLSPQSFSTVS